MASPPGLRAACRPIFTLAFALALGALTLHCWTWAVACQMRGEGVAAAVMAVLGVVNAVNVCFQASVLEHES